MREKDEVRIVSYMKKRRGKKIWQRVLSFLICIVVFCTTYALILPAITEETDTFCGFEEHIHDEKCYLSAETAMPELICGLEEAEEHIHTESCYLPVHGHNEDCYVPMQVLTCEQQEAEAHAHSETCYAVQTPVVCGLEESEGHVHGESCYSAPEQILTCALAETKPHSHGDECYTVTGGEQICGLEESEDHSHEAACYSETVTSLTCGQQETEGHAHDDACYTMAEGILTCTVAESEGHTHTEQCCGESAQILVCTQEETAGHIHDDTCYTAEEPILVCKLEEREEPILNCAEAEAQAHVHTKECYSAAETVLAEDTLVCELEEHTHELICYSDPTADVESREVWERTFANVELTGIWREDLLAIAESQLGYAESTRNYIVLEDGTTMKGYTRYGHWYGDHYGDWCAMFVSFCLHYAGVEQMPLESGCQRWIEVLSEANTALYHPAGTYEPQSGDLIFFDFDEYEDSDHVGLVYELYTADDGTERIRSIEGNVGDCVQYVTYDRNDPEIMGYAALPEQSVEATTDEPGLIHTSLTAAIYTDGSYNNLTDDSTVITITGLLPQNAEVRAYPVDVEADLNILCAYDISVFLPDSTVFEPAEGESLDVHIQSSVLNSAAEDIQAYHIPENGEPEPVDTTVTDDGVSFDAPHFSVYALTASGTMNAVYLNGASGNDAAAGTQNAPVKTLERAAALIAENGTIYISGTVTISDAQEWSLKNATIQRASSFTGVLINVSGSGSLTLSDITIHGGSGTPSSSNIATNTTYASNSAKAPLIVVSTGGSLIMNEGALLTNNSNKPDTSSNIFKENGYVGQGGAVYCNGTLTMNGGTVQYCEAQSGGGIYIENGKFYLRGGTIANNYARDIVSTGNRTRGYYKNAGGGVYVGDNSTMEMSGGLISGNQSSREGGGISLGWLNRKNGAAISSYITTFTMTGGTFDGNTATSTGGGLNITAGRQAFISAGTFTNNRANGQEYQPDSGYSSPSIVYSGGAIYLDAQQKNSSGQYSGKPGYAVINRVLIANNKANYYGGGIACCATATSAVNASVDLNNGTAIYNNTASYGNEMHLSGTVNLVSDTVLGGGAYNWSKSGSSYDNSLTDSSSAIVAAKKLATVIITDNYGYDGGGIGCNGTIEIGGDSEKTSLTITKEWVNAEDADLPAFIEVQIYRDGVPYGDPVKIIRAADSTWPSYHLDGLEAGHTYTIEEITVPGFISTVTGSGSSFTITNTRPLTSISVEKSWVGEGEHPDAVQIQLLADGIVCGDPVTLSSSNNWFWIWENLPKLNADGGEISYTVSEINPGDYNVTIEKTERTQAGGTVSEWQAVQTLENGKQYLLVSSSGALAASETSNLKWQDVSTNLKNGTMPDNTALWTYTNQTLKNGNGRYLRYSNNYITLSTSSSSVSFTNGRLQVGSRYFAGISSSRGTTTTSSNSATTFTAYALTTKTTEAATSTHFIVTNTAKPKSVTVNFGKLASGSTTYLAGADLALYQQDANSQTLIPSTNVNGTLIGEWTSEDIRSSSGGIHTLSLFDGTYYLIEKKAPDGYIGLSAPIIFEIDTSGGSVNVIEYPGYDDVSISAGSTVDFPVYNAPAFTLPETGGTGIIPYTAAGLLMMLVSSILLLITTRRRKGDSAE